MNEQLNMTVSLSVQGKEGYDVTYKFTNTRMKIVVLVEKLLHNALGEMLTITSKDAGIQIPE